MNACVIAAALWGAFLAALGVAVGFYVGRHP